MTNIKQGSHALLSASGSPKWTKCPASVAMEFGLDDDTNEYAEEGTRAHKLASDELDFWDDYNCSMCNYLFDCSDCSDIQSPLMLCKDEVMSEHIKCYIRYIYSFCADDSILYWEKKVDFSNVVINGYGTADAIVSHPSIEHLDVIDFKYGFTKVEAKDNTQMLLYAIGSLNFLYEESTPHPKTISLHIVQPRINNFDTWTITYDELMQWKTYFQVKTVRALTLVDDFNPSIDACKYCKAKTMCPALRDFVDNITIELKEKMDSNTLFLDTRNNKINLSSDFIKKVLDNSSLIKDYVRAVEELAVERLLGGDEIDTYKVVNSNTCRKLNYNAPNILSSKFGDVVFKKSLLGLSELEKIVGKETLDSLTHKDQGRPVVVKNSDRRLSIHEQINFENIN